MYSLAGCSVAQHKSDYDNLYAKTEQAKTERENYIEHLKERNMIEVDEKQYFTIPANLNTVKDENNPVNYYKSFDHRKQ